ncbi:hypothetical protein AAHH80_36975, partial [Burkholderia pseudomallei]
KRAEPPFGERYPDFVFEPYRPQTQDETADDEDTQDGENASRVTDPDATKRFADTIALTRDRTGSGAVTLTGLPAVAARKRV